MTLEDEYEQSERVRAWLRNNGSNLLSGIALGVGLIVGWNWWQGNRLEHAATAATQFQALIVALDGNDAETAQRLADSLKADYADTPYSRLGALRLADWQLGQRKAEDALAVLSAAAAAEKDDPLAPLLNLRIARLELALERAESALARLEATPPAYRGLAEHIRGDALRALGREQDARQAYQAALTHLDSANPNHEIVARKLAELGGAASEGGA